MYCYSINNFDCPDGLPICVRDTHQDPVSLLHRHDYLEIALVRLGHGIHTLHNDDGGKLESSIIKGDVFTILSGEAHSYRRCRDFRVYNICIAWSYWERIAAKLEFLEYYKSFLASRRCLTVSSISTVQPVTARHTYIASSIQAEICVR